MVCENLNFVLTEDCSNIPADGATIAVRDQYDPWVDAINRARCHMIVGLFDVLSGKHKGSAEAYEIMKSLEGFFGKQSSHAKYRALKAIVNSKKKPVTPAFVCVLKLMGLLDEVEANKGVIDTFTQSRHDHGIIVFLFQPFHLQLFYE